MSRYSLKNLHLKVLKGPSEEASQHKQPDDSYQAVTIRPTINSSRKEAYMDLNGLIKVNY